MIILYLEEGQTRGSRNTAVGMGTWVLAADWFSLDVYKAGVQRQLRTVCWMANRCGKLDD